MSRKFKFKTVYHEVDGQRQDVPALKGLDASEYDDTALRVELADHEHRIEIIEQSGTGGGVVLDPTLTDPHKAAPASMLGQVRDELSDQSESIIEIENDINNKIIHVPTEEIVYSYNDPTLTDLGNVYATPTGLTSNVQYRSWSVTQKEEYSVWVNPSFYDKYFSLALYNGVPSASTFITRLRKSEGNLPTKDNKLIVPAGTTLIITLETNRSAFDVFTTLTKYIYRLSDDISVTNTFYEYANEVLTIKQGKSSYVVWHNNNPSINLNTWMIKEGHINDSVVWENTDIEGPIKQVGTVDFIGGVHGDEIFTDVKIIIDGALLDISVPMKGKFDKIDIYVKSNLYYCNTDTVAFDRFKHLEFVGNKVVVSNKIVLIGDTNFSVERYTADGLYSVYEDALIGYSTNKDNELKESSSTNWSAYMNEGQFVGKGFFVKIRTIKSSVPERHCGAVSYFGSETRPRFKFYLDTINNRNGEYIIRKNDEISTSFEIEIY